MDGVAIIGAGELGGTLAYALARRNIASTIRLVDASGSVAAGKALDITQAAPIERFDTMVTGASDLRSASGASVIVIADRAGGDEWNGDDGLLLLKQLGPLIGRAVLLCAGATQRELVERGVRELAIPRTQIIGTAPEALASALRSLVALEANASPRDVGLTVLGVPPDGIVVPWEDATIGGLAATKRLDTPALRRVERRVAELWPPRSDALAAAAAKAVDVVLGNSRQMISCFLGPDDSSGRRMRAAALPAQLGPSGLVRVDEPRLNVHDRVALDNAVLL